jgi:23S rRNA (adenine2030-N6)-methyltransferase
VFMLWYPLKADDIAARVAAETAAMGVPAVLRIELRIREAFKGGGLAGSGMIIVNPPWTLDNDLRVLMPALSQRLGLGTWGHGTVDWLVPPK